MQTALHQYPRPAKVDRLLDLLGVQRERAAGRLGHREHQHSEPGSDPGPGPAVPSRNHRLSHFTQFRPGFESDEPDLRNSQARWGQVLRLAPQRDFGSSLHLPDRVQGDRQGRKGDVGYLFPEAPAADQTQGPEGEGDREALRFVLTRRLV